MDHPGDRYYLTSYSGHDATLAFYGDNMEEHSHSNTAIKKLDEFKIGVLEPICEKPNALYVVYLLAFVIDVFFI